jgi:putative ABC transport system permease protein
LRSALTVLSVALGVAVVLAIELAGRAASGSFLSSLKTLVGETDIEITANGGVDERWMARLSTQPWNARFVPVIEREVAMAGAGSTTLYGVDPFAHAPGADLPRLPEGADPESSIFLSRPLAARAGMRPGSPVQMLGQTFTVRGIVEGKEAEFAVLDIAAAQKALHAYGTLDRIDGFAPRGEDFARFEGDLRRLLPPSYFVTKPGARSEENQRMLSAFRWNLRVLSYISLIVGAFLIYNTIAVSVVRRRAEIGILGAVGASRAQIFWLFAGEALALGLVGSLVGLALGRLLAQAAVGLISGTVHSLYMSSRPAAIALDTGTALLAGGGGIAMSFLSAFAPAREATSVPPTEAMQRGAHEFHARVRWPRRLGMAALAAAAALAASQREAIYGAPVFGYLAALASIAAAALATPAVVLAANRLTRSAVRRFFGAPGILAGRSLEGSLARTSVIIAALGTAVAVMASIGIMVGSFRETVQAWLEHQLRADIYLRPAGRTGAGQFPAMPNGAIAIARSVPGIDAIDVFHGMEFRFRGERANLGAADFEIASRYHRLRFLEGGRGEAIVSEPLARKHRLHAGDRIALPLGGEQVPLRIAGVYYDYSSSQGWVLIDRSLLLRHLPNQAPTNVALYVRPQWRDRVERELRARLAGQGVVVARNDELRRNALQIFDRTFAITYALEGVAVVVAMLGAANSLLALVLDRRRELGLLRYLGAAPAQLRRVILLEAGFIGALANLLGLALGFALSLLLIFVVNKQSFGWTIQFQPPAGLLAGAFGLIWCATVLAALYPARIATRLNPIEAIHEE